MLLIYPSGLDFIKALYGCLYAGVVPIPTNPPGMNRSALRLYTIAKDAQATVALTTSELHQLFQFFQNEYPEIKNIRWITPPVMQADPDTWQKPELKPEGLAFIQYTSGSTNIPRGVVVSYRNLSYNRNVIMGVRGREWREEGTSIISWVPLFHDMGLITGIFQCVFDNSTGVLMSPIAFMQKPVRWLRTISNYKGTASGGPNFSYEVCVNKITPEECQGLDLSSWKLAFNSAEPVRAETQARFAKKFAPYGFEPEAFTPCYGLAEATLLISGYNGAAQTVTTPVKRAELEKGKLAPCEAGDETACANLVSCGPPLLDLQVAIANPQTGARSAPDEIGEIWVSGENICEGYWKLPEDTKEIFQARLQDSGEGPFLRTGDLGFMRDGNLYVTGRKKDLIIFRGRNYYPQDIELTVQNSHPLIRPGSGAAFSVSANGGEHVVVVQEVREKAARRPDLGRGDQSRAHGNRPPARRARLLRAADQSGGNPRDLQR